MATRRLGVRAPPQYGEFPTKSPLAVAAWVGHTASPQQADTASGNFSQSQGHTGYWQRFRQGSVVDAARSCLTGKASRKAPGLPNVFAQTAVRLRANHGPRGIILGHPHWLVLNVEWCRMAS